MTDTRERFIEAAIDAFAERGFHGTSIAAIAAPLPFTKQALLHHFGSKEQLYGEVLKRISDRYTAALDDADVHTGTPRERLAETLVALHRLSAAHRQESRLLMRELLDNQQRADTVRTWYLKPFLERLSGLVTEASDGRYQGPRALLLAYQLLGAMTYFLVSEPTLQRMFGETTFRAMREDYEAQLRELITARVDAPESG